MSNFKIKTPIAFIIFKRSDTTQRVFQAIRQAKPTKLFVIADGPRSDIPEEAEKCATTRAIIDRVDWDCEVYKNYSETNLGCGKRVSSGLNWLFEHVDEAIILEDDCWPHSSFFPFCEQLLERYRHDERIMNISGNNFQFGRKRDNYSYYFSRYPHIWGWATWKRAWKFYDFEMKLWPEVKEHKILKTILPESDALEYWNKTFQIVDDQKIDTWDYQWVFSCWMQNGLGIIPNVNLVSNIGFGYEGTNTINKYSKFTKKFANLPAKSINFPLKHPSFVVRNLEADNFTRKEMFMLSKADRVKLKIKNLIKITY